MTTPDTADVAQIFAAVDAQDVQTITSLLAEDASFTFGNNETLVGRDQIREGVTGFFQTIAGLKHSILKTWSDDTDVVVEATATYDRLDGQQVTIPVVSILSRDAAAKITSYRVYFDLTPVYAL